MLSVTEGVLVILLPVAVAAGVLLLWVRQKVRADAGVIWAVAICLAVVVSSFATDALAKSRLLANQDDARSTLATYSEVAQDVMGRALHPTEARHWWPTIALTVIAATWLATRFREQRPFTIAMVQIGVCIAIAARLLWTSVYVQTEWTTWESTLWLGGLGIVAGLLWYRMSESRGDDQSGLSRLFGCGLTLAATAAVLFTSGSVTYGMLGVALACSTGGAWLFGWLRKAQAPCQGWAGAVVVFCCAQLLLARSFAELRDIHAALILLALTIAALLPFRRASGFWRLAAQAIIAALPAFVAAAWALTTFIQETMSAPANPYDVYR